MYAVPVYTKFAFKIFFQNPNKLQQKWLSTRQASSCVAQIVCKLEDKKSSMYRSYTKDI